SARHELVRKLEIELALESANTRGRKLADPFPEALDELPRRLQWHEVGLGEVAVVVRLLLRAVHGQMVRVRVVVVGRLLELLAALVRRDLLADRRVDSTPDERERVHVLQLPARSIPRLSALADRDVDVGTQRPLLHLCVGNAEL